jgi:hypothetical protein
MYPGTIVCETLLRGIGGILLQMRQFILRRRALLIVPTKPAENCESRVAFLA